MTASDIYSPKIRLNNDSKMRRTHRREWDNSNWYTLLTVLQEHCMVDEQPVFVNTRHTQPAVWASHTMTQVHTNTNTNKICTAW